MAREGREGRILRRRSKEHAGDEVEHRVAGRSGDEEAGDQGPGQEGIGRRPGYQDRDESDPGASSRQEQGGHVVDVESRRKSRDAADDDAEEDQDEECDDEDRDIHDGARQASGVNLVDARSLRSVPPRLGGTPTASTRRLDYDKVVSSKPERHFRRKGSLTPSPPVEGPTRSTVL